MLFKQKLRSEKTFIRREKDFRNLFQKTNVQAKIFNTELVLLFLVKLHDIVEIEVSQTCNPYVKTFQKLQSTRGEGFCIVTSLSSLMNQN